MRMRATARIGAWAVAAMAVAAPAGALGAVAGVQDDRLTTATTTLAIDGRLDKVKASGAKFSRVDLLWSEIAPTKPANPIDPADPAYNFGRADQIVTGLRSRGITPLLTVYSSPTWANGGKAKPKSTQYNPFTPNAVQFGQFMQALAQRYNGTFSPGEYAPVLPRVRHFEIWNEPNLQLFYRPQYKGKGIRNPVAAKNYSNLVKAAYPRIKSVNPAAIVIAGVTGPKSSNDASGQGTLSWLKSLAKVKPKMDAYSQHIYPAVAPDNDETKAVPSWNSINLLLGQVSKIKRGLPMYITEAGYTTAATKFRKVKVSFSVQRTNLNDIFALRTVKQKRVPVIVWFNLQDNVFWPGGLLRANGAKKPSYASFQAIARKSVLTSALKP
jgi:Cellulase (glycosyl hydrolase family 5)